MWHENPNYVTKIFVVYSSNRLNQRFIAYSAVLCLVIRDGNLTVYVFFLMWIIEYMRWAKIDSMIFYVG